MESQNANSKNNFYWLVGAVVIVVALLVGARLWVADKRRAEFANKTTREIVFSCTSDEATRFHVHTNLEIIINGQKQEIPENIGVSSSCLHPLHTHDEPGLIHIESPVARDFTLADFFAVWDKTFNKNQIFDNKSDARHAILITVNGREVATYENTVLRDNEQIVIRYEELNAASVL